MSKSYSDKLKDPRWQKKRLKILERDNFTCQGCEETEKTLNVHHKNYYHKKDPWDCHDNNLITYCDQCHDNEHHFKEEFFELVHDLLLQGESYFSLWMKLSRDYKQRIFADKEIKHDE